MNYSRRAEYLLLYTDCNNSKLCRIAVKLFAKLSMIIINSDWDEQLSVIGQTVPDHNNYKQ